MSIIGSVISAIAGDWQRDKALTTQVNLELERQRRQEQYNKEAAAQQQAYNERNMELSYQYGEQAAAAADARTRALYEELYGPEATTRAQMNALKENELSPALMYGGQGVSGGSSTPSGAKGTGTPPLATNVQPVNAINPLQGMQLDLAWAQIQKTLAETESIRKLTKREEEKQSKILMNYDNVNDKLKAETGLLIQQAETEKQKAYLTEWQGKMQKLQAEFFNETKDLNKEFLERNVNKITEEIEAIMRQNDIAEETKETQIKIVYQTYENMVADYLLKQADKALKESGKKLTDQQVKLAKQNLHLAMQQISVNSSEIAKNRANEKYLNELADNIDKQFNLNQSLGWGKLGAQFIMQALSVGAIFFTKNPKVAALVATGLATQQSPTSDMYY